MLCAKRLSLCVFLFASRLQFLHCLFKGDRCHHDVENAPGTCKIINDCQGAISDLKKGIRPQSCGFEGSLPIVCCADNASSPTVTTNKLTETTPKQATGIRSLQKCEDYKQHVYVREIVPLLIPNATLLVSKCVFDRVNLPTIGVERTKRREFPHMALIGFDNGNEMIWKCGGALISENYVLTAAHCLFSRNYGKPTTVRLGDLNVTDPSDDENVQQIGIKKHIVHPEYQPPSIYDDIALLLLETPAKLGIFVRPACLYTKRTTKTQFGVASSWGFTDDGGNKGDWLMKVILHSFTTSTCNITYADATQFDRGIDDATQLCAGSDDVENDICQRHSGGPLQIYSETYCMYDIIGVTSFGKICRFVGIPTVFTKVYPYLQWIEDIVWP